MVKAFLLLTIICLFAKETQAQCTEIEVINLKKTAIIFGEQDYKYVSPLANPTNDARDISDSLKRLGFSVYTYFNADKKTMTTAIEEWYTKIGNYDVALFYYSGHGAEVNGENFLFPIDANPKGISDLYYAAYPANRVLANMELANSKVNIMILDACRNNPFRSITRDIKNGLAPMTGKGSFIGFAASPGTVASDGDKRNGFYTEAILKYISVPNSTIDQIFTKVNQYVRNRSSGQQIPYKNSSLSFDFCFSVKNEKSSATKSTVIQPASGLFLAMNEERIFTSDSTNAGILVKDSKNLSNLNFIAKDKVHPYKITGRGKDNYYLIDTVSRKFIVFSGNSVKSEIQLKGQPSTLVISNDEKKAYITTQQKSNEGSIIVVDITANKLGKPIIVEPHVQGITLSTSGKNLYAISQCMNEKGFMYVIDTKTDKVAKTFEGTACGEAIGLLPNGKSMFTSSIGEGSLDQINIVDVNTLKNIKTLDYNSKGFSFTLDSKYVFVLGRNEVAVIRTDDNEIINKLPFATAPKGVALSDDGRVFVLLPKENRTAVFSLSEIIQSELPIDPETKLKLFKEEYNKKLAIDTKYKLTENFENLYWAYIHTISRLGQELGPLYETDGGATIRDNNEGIFKMEFGFQFKGDKSKRIIPKLTARFTDNFLVISIAERGKEEIYKVPNSNIDWIKVENFIRTFFLNRIDQLK